MSPLYSSKDGLTTTNPRAIAANEGGQVFISGAGADLGLGYVFGSGVYFLEAPFDEEATVEPGQLLTFQSVQRILIGGGGIFDMRDWRSLRSAGGSAKYISVV